MRSVLLVELAATDRFHRAIEFPYMLGEARRLGASCRWLRFGVPAAVQFVTGEAGIALGPEDAGTLLDALRRRETTDVVFGQVPASSLVGLLSSQVPLVRLAVLSEADGAAASSLDKVSGEPPAWREFLGADAGADAGLRVALPDFGFEPANEAARQMQPLPFLVVGPECSYNRPFSGNRFLAGLDLASCLRSGGCSFCTRPEESSTGGILAEEAVREHLAALRRTLPPPRVRLAVRMLGEAAIQRLPAIVRAVEELGFEPLDLLFDSRADLLVRERDRLGEAARRLEGTGHRLHLALIGIENFAADELERLNKGVTPEQNLDAVLTLLRLEREHPATFRFREHGGLSLILFTPWTSLEDLAFNLRILQVCRLEATCGKALTSRLRLVPGLPLTERARRDGLLVEQYGDAAFDTSARNLYAPELPWRFVDDRVESVCRALTRLGGDTPFTEADFLWRDAQVALARAARAGRGPLDLGLAIVDSASRGDVAAEPGSTGREPGRALLQAGADALDTPQPGLAPDAPESWIRFGGQAKRCARAEDRLWAELSRLGLKPVSKVEPIHPGEIDAWLGSDELPNPRVRRRLTGGVGTWEGFFGADAGAVEEAVALGDVNEAGKDLVAWSEATRRLGRLLGYPDCCVNAYLEAETPASRRSYTWMHLERRMAIEGGVFAELNPWSGGIASQYVPCSLRCEASRALAERVLEAGERVLGRPWAEGVRRERAEPWLVWLDSQTNAVPLRFVDVTAGELEIRPNGDDRGGIVKDLIGSATRVRIDGDRVRTFDGSRLVSDLSARAFVWWHEERFQAGFWRRVLEIRRLQDGVVRADGAPRRPAPVYQADAKDEELLRAFRLVLGRAAAASLLPTDSVLGPPRVVAPGELALRIRLVGQDPLEIRVRRSRPGEPALATIGPFALRHAESRLPGGPDGRRALAALVRAVEKAVGDFRGGARED